MAIDGRKIGDYGIGTYIRGLLRGLAEIGAPEDEYVVFAPASARPLIPFEHRLVDAPHYSIQELVAVGSAIRAVRPDLFHAPHYVLPVTRTPSVVTIHDLIHLRMRHANPFAPAYARMMLTRAARAARCVLTVSEAVGREIESSLRPRRVVVTPNGAGSEFVPEGPRRAGRYFLYVGNDKPHKNVERLVEAFERMRVSAVTSERVADVELVLAGAPFERFRTRATCLGFVPDQQMPELYRGAIALLMPSLDEGFGLPALEAMACGTAVITSAAPALVEVTADAALHVDALDSDAMCAAMTRLADDETQRRQLGTRGVERARAFTWRRCAELTRQAYRQAAATR